MENYDRVLVAFDGTEASRRIADRGINIASVCRAELCFAHVSDQSPAASTLNNLSLLSESVKCHLEIDFKEELERARNDERIKDFKLLVGAGSITEVLSTQLIPEFKPDLIICGKRRLSLMRFALMGSVSTFLVRNAKCDVLVLR